MNDEYLTVFGFFLTECTLRIYKWQCQKIHHIRESSWSLQILWGQELLHGHIAEFYNTPTISLDNIQCFRPGLHGPGWSQEPLGASSDFGRWYVKIVECVSKLPTWQLCILLNLLITLSFFPVPGPPSNVTLVSDSQHSIVVYIAQPLPLMRNGIIVGYTVFYKESNILPDEGYLSVSTNASSVTLANLTVFTEYSVKVAASTSVGMGNESGLKTVVTQEGGRLLFFLFQCLDRFKGRNKLWFGSACTGHWTLTPGLTTCGWKD